MTNVVQFNLNGGYMLRDADPPQDAAFTDLSLIKILTYPAGGTQYLDLVSVRYATSGNASELFALNDGTAHISLDFGADITVWSDAYVGWLWTAFQFSDGGGGTTTLSLYVMRQGDVSWTLAGTRNGTTPFNPDRNMMPLNTSFISDANGQVRLACKKGWNRVLTLTELTTEANSPSALVDSTDNIYFLPATDASTVGVDQGPLASNWTVTGTVGVDVVNITNDDPRGGGGGLIDAGFNGINF